MGTPKSSILVGFSLINHPAIWYPIYGNPHVRFLIVISTQDFVPSGGECPKKSFCLWRRCTEFSKRWSLPRCHSHSVSHLGAVNIHSYQPFCFTRPPAGDPCPHFRHHSDTSELNWLPDLSCLSSMHNRLPCFPNTLTLSLFEKNNLKIGGSKFCMLDAYECLNNLTSTFTG